MQDFLDFIQPSNSVHFCFHSLFADTKARIVDIRTTFKFSTHQMEKSMHPPETATAPDTTLAKVIYVLYFAGFFTGITALIGLVMAYVKKVTPIPLHG
ncbi:hypothetical protein [Thiomicrospira sp. WB1]|uniref:hypothetical protein n=1 Tax=Thiomicrospira sp. WB1 TaxID=1685380 RepID=UPI001F2296FD|nr:hypothetical protein [Thiomicrospira sp. WB1]